MKKTALLLVLVIVMSLAMTSCQPMLDKLYPLLTELELMLSEPTDAIGMWENIDTRMDSLTSFESKTNMAVNLAVEDSTLDVEVLYHHVKMQDYYYHTIRSSLKIDSEEIVTEEVLAYVDGRMYVLKSKENTYSRICSDATYEEFNEYLVSNAEDSLMSTELFKNAFTQEFTKNADSTITVTFTDFPKSDIETTVADLGLKEALAIIDDDVDDIHVEIVADSKYRAMKMNISLLRDGDKDAMIVLKTNYGRYNSAERVEFDTKAYKAVGDARIPGWVYESIFNKITAESCDFVFECRQWLKYKSEVYDISSEKDTVHFDNDPDDGFSFYINAVYDGTAYTLSYNNGTLTTLPAGGSASRDAMTDDEARLAINTLINASGYEPYMVYSLKKQKDGSFTMYCNVYDESEYEYIVTTVGLGSYVGYDQYIDVVMDGKEVDKLNVNITLKGTSGEYHINYTYDFETTKEANGTDAA